MSSKRWRSATAGRLAARPAPPRASTSSGSPRHAAARAARAEDAYPLLAVGRVHRAAHLRRLPALRALLPVLPGIASERRQSAYDMSRGDRASRTRDGLRSPSQPIKIEFQGGEPLLNFDSYPSRSSSEAETLNEHFQRDLVLRHRDEPRASRRRDPRLLRPPRHRNLDVPRRPCGSPQHEPATPRAGQLGARDRRVSSASARISGRTRSRR